MQYFSTRMPTILKKMDMDKNSKEIYTGLKVDFGLTLKFTR